MKKLIQECERLHNVIEEAKASNKTASKKFTNVFIKLVKAFESKGKRLKENRREFYALFPMDKDIKLASRVKTAATRYIQFVELTGKQPDESTGLPQRGYGAMKEYAPQPKISQKDTLAEILPEVAVVELFSSLSKELQKETLKKLQVIVKANDLYKLATIHLV